VIYTLTGEPERTLLISPFELWRELRPVVFSWTMVETGNTTRTIPSATRNMTRN